MRKTLNQIGLRSALGLAVVAGGFAPAWAHRPGDEEGEKTFVVVQDDDEDGDDEVHEEIVVVNAGDQPKLWLGIGLKEVEGDLARYLGTEEGILIDDVYDESPAATAGLKEGDILVKVGSDKVGEPEDLLVIMKEVEEGDALKLGLLRKGKKVTVEVTPAVRPPMDELVNVFDLKVDAEGWDEGAVKDMVRKLQLRADGKDLNVLRLGGPVFQWRTGGDEDAHVVESVDGKNLEIQVVRKDDEPMKIIVVEDGKKSEFTEDDMDEMPAEIAARVKKIAKGNRFQIEVMPEELELAINHEEMAKKAREMAERVRVQALENAKMARDQASRLRMRVEKEAGSEVKELRSLVEELKKELHELRKQLEDK